MTLTYARDLGNWHVHLVPTDDAQPDGLRETAICGLYRFSPTWPKLGADELRYRHICKLCIRSMRARKLEYPPLPLLVNLNAKGEAQ